MDIRRFLLGRDEFKSPSQIVNTVRESKYFDTTREHADNPEALLIFQTSEQQTWLAATTARLYCVLDDIARSFTRVQWAIALDELLRDGAILKISVRDKTTRTGLIDIGNHRNWLFSKRLFTSSRIEDQLRDLIRRQTRSLLQDKHPNSRTPADAVSASRPRMSTGLENLKHIVVLMMSGRSFDHMLGFSATPTWQIDGLTGQEGNRDSTGEFVQVAADARYIGDFTPSPGYALFDTLTQLYGGTKTPVSHDPTMNGFMLSYEGKTHNPESAHRIMKCFSPNKVPVLATLARQFAVCDRWFSSVPGPTFPNQAYAHGATSVGRVDMGVDWLGMSKTIYELLAENNVDARIYYHDSTMAMTFKGLMNQGRYFGLFDDFLSDCSHNRLPAYSFIEPRYANGEDPVNNTFFSASDQHPDHNVEQGEILIRDTFNTIWKNQALRESTLLVVVYDEHGGFYDHVPPPSAVNPDDKKWAGDPSSLDPAFDFTRLGVRVPAVLISPYIPAGTIDHTIYDHSSIVATACKLLLRDVPGASLTSRDRNANTFERNLVLAMPRTDAVTFTLTDPPNQAITALGTAHVEAVYLNADISDDLAAQVEATSLLERRLLPPDQRSGIDPSDIRSEKQASDFLQSVHPKLLAHAKARPGAAGLTMRN